MTEFEEIVQRARGKLQGSSIIVDRNTIIEKADRVSGAISNVERLLDEIQAIVTRTSGYWTGEAADWHRKMFTDEKDEMGIILRRLKEHPENLRLMAMNYERVEGKAASQNQQLRNDYI